MSDQVGQFIDAAQKELGTAPVQQDQPKVAFQTDLKLTADQEKKMIEHAFARMETIANELGRPQAIQPIWWMNNTGTTNQLLASQGLGMTGDTFFSKRNRFDATFMNDVSWRPYTMGPETIFSSSNIAVPVVRRVCRQMIARAKNSFFGTDPWFSVDPTPVPQADPTIERQDEDIERFCRFKLRQTNTKEDHGRAISRSLILGECPVKTYYVVRDQIFNTESEVLTGIDGQPVRGEDGNTITKDDKWVDAQDGAGTQVLQRDGITPHPNPLAPIWQTLPLDKRQVLYEGVKSEPIYYKDFLCPLTASSVQEADCIVHLYDKNVMEFVDLVVKRGMVGDTAPERIGAAQKIIAVVQSLSDNSPAPKAAMGAELRPNENFQSAPVNNSSGSPIAEFAEFYMWFDANGDGVAENIMLIADRKTRTPVFYDHVANVTTDGLRPIEIVRINPVEGRWYGQGIMELFESYQTILDLLVNRWNFSQSRAGRVDFWDPSRTLEGDNDPQLKMNYGRAYTAKPGQDVEKILKSVYLTDIKFEQIQTQIQLFMQLLMNESGVSTSNDDATAGSETGKLATGIIQSTKSGDELFKPIIADLQGPLTRLLNREIDVTLANINPTEAFSYLQGDVTKVGQITADAVRGLKYRAQISLTTFKNQEIVQLSGQAAALVEKFYLLAPAIQPHVAPFYRQMLRALAPTVDADTTIVPMPPPPPTPEPTKSSLAIAAKLPELTPEERVQAMSDIGIKSDGTVPPAVGGDGAPKKNGANGHKLGKATTPGDGGRAASPAQLMQRHSQPTGVSASGGTPAAN